MKVKNLPALLIAIATLHYSCNKNNNEILTESTTLSIEAEGGQLNIPLDDHTWIITGVINKNGNTNMWGNIYDADAKVIKKNGILQLNEPGSLEVPEFEIGLKVIYHNPHALNIILTENRSDEDFNFTILLKNQNRTREIVVHQKKSNGYSFEKITYAFGENDTDSLYMKITHRITLINHGSTPGSSVSFDPLGKSSEIMNISYFKSDMPDAFKWLEKDSVEVDVPLLVDNGIKWSGGEKRIYGIITELMGKSNKIETVTSEPGESRYYTEVEFRKRQVSYVMRLINNRTGARKTIEGKWIEHAPTGKYKVVKEL